MNCQEVKELLSAYIDRELTRTETREVTNHLKACRDCTRELVSLRKLTGILYSLPEVKAPARMADNVQQEISRQAPPAKEKQSSSLFRQRWVWGSLTAAAAAVLLVVANFSFFTEETFNGTTVTRIPNNGAETISEDLFSSEPEKGLALTEKPAAPTSTLAPTVTTAPPPPPPPAPVLTHKSSERITGKGDGTDIHLKENSRTDAVNLKRAADEKDRLTKKGKKIIDQWGRQLKTKAGQPSDFVQADRSAALPQLLNLSQEVVINCADLTACENQINLIISDETRKFQAGYRRNEEQLDARLGIIAQHESSAKNEGDLKLAKAVEGGKQRRVRQFNFQVPLEQKEQVIDRLKQLGRVKVRQLNLPASPAGGPDAGRQNESFNQLAQLNQFTRQRLSTIKKETIQLQSRLSKSGKDLKLPSDNLSKQFDDKPTAIPVNDQKKPPDAPGKFRAKAPSREESNDLDETQTASKLNFGAKKLQVDRQVSQEKIVRELENLEDNLVREYDLRQQQRALESLKETNREGLSADKYRWSEKEAQEEGEEKKLRDQEAYEYRQRQRGAKQQNIQLDNQLILSETLIDNLRQNSMVELIIILEEE